MNNLKCFFILLAFAFVPSVPAQLNSMVTNVSVTNVSYAVAARDANSRQWVKITSETNAAGQTIYRTNRAYVELASGLNRFLTESNAWVDADPTIDIVGNSASATRTAHTVTFAQDAATPGGAVNLTTPDGKNFVARVYGLSYWDPASGSNVLLGAIQSSQGNVVGASEVVYSNAFSGSVTADLEYFNKLSGLEQNVVLRTALPAPDAFGLNDATARLQVWTEFLAAPEPQEVQGMTDEVTDDLLLDFGAMKMGQGTAFATPPEQGRVKKSHVSKHWLHQDGRTFLIEEVPYKAILDAVQNLPPHASVTQPNAGGIKNTASMLPLHPRIASTDAVAKPMRLAMVANSGPGVVIDYALLSEYETNYVFQADTTYYVSGPLALYGTNEFEAGTVLKFNQSSGEIGNFGASPLAINGSSYRPINFTSSDDNSIGETISGSTGSPHQGLVNDYLIDIYTCGATNVTMSHVRFSYAPCAYEDDTSGSSHLFRDCQFVQCGNDDTLLLPSGTDLYLENVLFSHINIGLGTGMTLHAVNITADTITNFLDPIFWSGGGGGITNSILTACDSSILTNFYLYDTVTNASGSGIYQKVGAGNYYLTNGSAARGVATRNVDATTLADLQGMTTYPPVVISNSFSVNTILGPQATRDTGLADAGYHYAPLDYVCSNLVVDYGVTLVLTNGVAVGTLNALGLMVEGTLSSVGTPVNLNYLGSCEAVQEEPWTNLATLFEGDALWQSMSFRFTQLPMLGGYGNYLDVSDTLTGQITGGPLAFQDCQLAGGTMDVMLGSFNDGMGDVSSLSISLLNNVFDRCEITVQDVGAAYVSLACRNDLFHGGVFNGYYLMGGFPATWSFNDNLFDNTSLQVVDELDAVPDWLYEVTSGNNGYIGTEAITNLYLYEYGGGGPDDGDGVNDLYPSVGNYETGVLGRFYYPPSGGNLSALIHAGDQPAANVGLYHYTVLTNNTIEGANTVSIGFHYVATDQYGNPLSTLVPGVPDYVVDANGDGVYDSGDLLNWNNPFAIYDQWVSYGGYHPANMRLGYWKFDTVDLTNEAGKKPYVTNNMLDIPSWSGNAIISTNTNGFQQDLEYYLVETNGSTNWTNFNYVNGTIRFWYQPTWSSAFFEGTNQNYGTLIQAGGTGSNQWDLYILVSDSTCKITFQVESNGYTVFPFNNSFTEIDFQSGLWYQIALTYSPTNVALYTNGVLFATGGGIALDPNGNQVQTVGCGEVFYPAWADLDVPGFGFGCNIGGGAADGELDELETFNYPLTAEAIAAGFPTFAGSTTNTQDSSYVGRSDMLQTYVDGNFPPTNPVAQSRLGYWRFDSPLLFAEQGQMPISQSGVTLSNDWSGTAVNIGSGSASQLTYPEVGTNGWANFNCSNGSVMLWFKPNWSSSSGAPSYAPLIFLGTNSTPSAWCLGVSSGSIIFDTEAGSTHSNRVLSVSFPFTNNQWCQIALTYGPNGSILYTNGVPAQTNSSAISYCPNATDRAHGLVIGNTSSHNKTINGQIDELETYNYNLSASDIATNFQMVAAVDRNLDGVPDVLEDIHLTKSTPYLGVPTVVTGTVKAEEFDMGGTNTAYYAARTYPTNVYRKTGMFITNCDDLGLGYCVAMGTGDWANYSINVLATGTYVVEARVAGMGTGGTFQVSITNANGGPTTGPMAVPTTGWTNITNLVTLTNLGTNILTLTGVSAGTDSPYVGRFNYISVYPYVPTPAVGPGSTNVTPFLVANADDFVDASNNAVVIQSAVDSLVSGGGGTVTISDGIYYIAQASPNESNTVYENAAIVITNNDIAICGMGISNTTLIAFDRVTTLFSIGIDQFENSTNVTNFTLSGLTIEGQPHEFSTNVGSPQYYSNFFEYGEFNPPDLGIHGAETSALTYFFGPSDVLITNCEFLHTLWGIKGTLFDSTIQNCTFIQWDSNCTFTGVVNNSPSNTANTLPKAPNNVSVFVGGTNLVLVGNIYNGNAALTNTNSTLMSTSFVNTNLLDIRAPDGWVWMQGGGNVFIARNAITNNFVEAVQLNQGPNAVVQNTFYTLLNNHFGESALTCGGQNFGGWDGSKGPPAYTSAFMGNLVYGDCAGVITVGGSLPTNANVHVSGNFFYQPFPPFTNSIDGYGEMVGLENCQTASICGNTMAAGGYGVAFTIECTNTLILNNDFSAAAYLGIGYQWGGDVQNVGVFGNKIGEGLTFHARNNYDESFGWFFKQNTYLNGTNSVAPFFDPIASEAHISN